MVGKGLSATPATFGWRALASPLRVVAPGRSLPKNVASDGTGQLILNAASLTGTAVGIDANLKR